MGWEKKMDDARRGHRPSLDNWEQDGLYETFPAFQQSVLERSNCEAFCIVPDAPKNIPAYVDGRTVSPDTFARDYEAKTVPCVITSIPECDEWAAVHDWDVSVLQADENMRNRYFKCGEDDDGKSIKV